MTANINPNVLKNFILKQVGASMTQGEAQKLGVEKEYAAAAEEADVNELNLDDIMLDTDLYEQFASMYGAEQDDKKAAKDEEAEKKDQTQIKGKNGAGV